jgi:hypothetical protein
MNKTVITTLILCTLNVTPVTIQAQSLQVGEILIVSNATLKKKVNPETFHSYIKEEVSAWNKDKLGVTIQLFKADRGKRNGEYLLVCGITSTADRKMLPEGSPFTEKVLSGVSGKRPSDFLDNPNAYTEYQLLGAEKFESLPSAGILGIHYIQVKEERAREFEKFVVEKLHPAVGRLFPDMQLLYYKAVAGEQAGSYITIFTIKSVQARDKYWPAGAPETEILKKTFQPHKELAKELGTYLVPDSYLGPESGGAAAYFESKVWTDFVHQKL